MKKILIISASFVVVAIGITMLLSRAGFILDAENGARTKAIEAQLKVFALNTMIDILKFYSDDKNLNLSYVMDEKNVAKIDLDFLAIKNKYSAYNSENFLYKIFDEKENAAVKVQDSGRGIYLCVDSLTVKPVVIPVDQFDKKTDCAGGVLN